MQLARDTISNISKKSNQPTRCHVVFLGHLSEYVQGKNQSVSDHRTTHIYSRFVPILFAVTTAPMGIFLTFFSLPLPMYQSDKQSGHSRDSSVFLAFLLWHDGHVMSVITFLSPSY